MMNGKRIAAALVLAGAAHGFGLSAAIAQKVEPKADELSSVDWRDCAGHFFFLAKMTSGSDDKKITEKFNSWAILAVYAGETKANAEAAAGDTSNGHGKSAANAETGKLDVDVQGMISDHTEKARKQGQNAYVESYAAKCAKPIQAYSQRFMKSVEAQKSKESEKPKKQ